ncbi:MAG: ParB N-terminal domain-containing protein [Caldimicrobium sp.]|nr:ParB N-terminal domain-containing protein [Caldimicrobium sp.]MCX7874396.1 ParB N-terminal domain-containing protein [Caldimicrobium sp.]MDW8094018.1 ParB N-terminal domain-containing protein [Caldimicrobium sp.]
MKLPFKEFKQLSLREINLNRRDYLFSFPGRKEYVLKSIREVGLLEPPLLFPSDEGLVIISGEGRIKAALELGWHHVPALILEPNLSPKELISISLESNLWRGLNLVEKAQFLAKAQSYFDEEELLSLLEKLNFTKHKKWISWLLMITSLEIPYLQLLAEEKLNPKIIEELWALTAKEREEFLFLLKKLSLSFSEQREVINTLMDYKRRSNGDTLLPEELRNILFEEDVNKRRRLFWEALEKIKFPNFHLYKMAMNKICSSFESQGISLKFAPYLEKKEILCSFKVSNEKELERILNFLQNEGYRAFEIFK